MIGYFRRETSETETKAVHSGYCSANKMADAVERPVTVCKFLVLVPRT